jgi:hypothetical protein
MEYTLSLLQDDLLSVLGGGSYSIAMLQMHAIVVVKSSRMWKGPGREVAG